MHLKISKENKERISKIKYHYRSRCTVCEKTVMDICKENGWKYIIRFKEGTIPTLYKEFETIAKKDNESRKKGYEAVTKMEYQEDKVNVVRYIDKNKRTEFTYITNLPITDKNIENTVEVGRSRWKIENEGFNIQKNGTFDIGHLYSKNAIAINENCG